MKAAILLATLLVTTSTSAMTAAEIVENSFNYMRGDASVSTVVMTIHRPGWQREMIMDAWTLGQTDSLIRIQSPAKDKGNGTLKKCAQMWIYNPKVNRTIKLPPSMMSQSWMGSDFSNNDLAKSDSLIHDYTHTLKETIEVDGHVVYLIESMPTPDAPVVWGMQRLKIRDDLILLSQEFFDEDLAPVKTMTCHDIRQMSGRLFPARWRMQKADVEDEYTEMVYRHLAFKDALAPSIFTLSSLKTRRR
ncbi:MAG: outer membrane lipoprotein-sorting protein [Desulfosarcina sp.]|nr:outer membrane lipoprotein-sorting protein [Desulfosarcina sp.]MBC2764940.1 outer membrane lipoprotein-sorting protein [Desulfosarcina sp.]